MSRRPVQPASGQSRFGVGGDIDDPSHRLRTAVGRRPLAPAVFRFNAACRPEADRPSRPPALWIASLQRRLRRVMHRLFLIGSGDVPLPVRKPTMAWPGIISRHRSWGFIALRSVAPARGVRGVSIPTSPHAVCRRDRLELGLFFCRGIDSPITVDRPADHRRAGRLLGLLTAGNPCRFDPLSSSGRDCLGLHPLAGLRDRSALPDTSIVPAPANRAKARSNRASTAAAGRLRRPSAPGLGDDMRK